MLEIVSNGDSAFHLIGELDTATAPELENQLEGVAPRRNRSLVLNLSRLTFIDSSGLRVIIQLAKRMDQGVPLVLESPSRQVARAIELLGLTDGFPGLRVVGGNNGFGNTRRLSDTN